MEVLDVLFTLTGATAVYNPRLSPLGEYDPKTNSFAYREKTFEVFSHELGHAFYSRVNRCLGLHHIARETEIFARACENLNLGASLNDAEDVVSLGFEDWRRDGGYYYLYRGMKKEPYDPAKLAGYIRFLLHFTLGLKQPTEHWYLAEKHRKLIEKMVPGSRACFVFWGW